MRLAAIAASTIVVAGVFLAIVAATGADVTVITLGLISIAVVAAIVAVAMGAPATQRAASVPPAG